MRDQLEFLSNELQLKQSELYGDLYQQNEFNFTAPTFNELSIHSLADWINSLNTSYDLSTEQRDNLMKLVNKLYYILELIDPLRIKDIRTSMVDDEDFLMWRETEKGIGEITLEADGDIVYRFTQRNGDMNKMILKSSDTDFEKLIFNFLS